MKDEKELTRISKKLSLLLRHKPEQFGITLDKEGWANVHDVLKALNISMSTLEEIVEKDKKGRYVMGKYKMKIRAAQGHSIKVDLGLKPVYPPSVLYHGTAVKNIGPIMKDGLLKMNRQYVHLSVSVDTARIVGARHGKPIVFKMEARRMWEDGHRFYQAENGVWLIDHVPACYLELITEGEE